MTRDDDQDRSPQFFIGPETRGEVPSLLDDARDRVRDEDEKNKESARLARRLFMALILIAAMSIVFYVVMPYYGLRLPPYVPILCFISIATGAILTYRDTGGG